MVRLRLYETLTLLPASSLESSYTHLLRMLVSEFTLTENPANTTNSLLRELCHSDDSIILGSWLQEVDHKTIEDQVKSIKMPIGQSSIVPNISFIITIGSNQFIHQSFPTSLIWFWKKKLDGTKSEITLWTCKWRVLRFHLFGPNAHAY